MEQLKPDDVAAIAIPEEFWPSYEFCPDYILH